MPKRSSIKHEDPNQAAARVVAASTNTEIPDNVSERTEKEISTARIAAAMLGKLGGLKGGPARRDKLSAERRKEIAQKAAQARWEKQASKEK